MFNKVFYIRDPKTGFFWNGEVPGNFTLQPGRFWYSRNDAISKFDAYLLYQAELKTQKLPLELEIIENEVSLTLKGAELMNNKTNCRPYLLGRFKRAFGKRTWGSDYDGLLYLAHREKEPQLFPYWCKLEAGPWQVAAKHGNTALFDLVGRSVCVKNSLKTNSNAWIGLRDIVDYTFLKLAVPILITVVTEDYLK